MKRNEDVLHVARSSWMKRAEVLQKKQCPRGRTRFQGKQCREFVGKGREWRKFCWCKYWRAQRTCFRSQEGVGVGGIKGNVKNYLELELGGREVSWKTYLTRIKGR